MKRISPKLEDLLKSEFVESTKAYNTFKRKWGTTTIGGVEVFLPRLTYLPMVCTEMATREVYDSETDETYTEDYCASYDYPEYTRPFIEWAKLRGKLTKESKGLRSAFLFLNPFKSSDNIAWDKSGINTNVTRSVGEGFSGTITIGAKGVYTQGDRNTDVTLVRPPIDESLGIANEVVSKYHDMRADGHPIITNDPDLYRSVVLMYLLESGSSKYTITGARKVVSTFSYSIPKTRTSYNSEGYAEYETYYVKQSKRSDAYEISVTVEEGFSFTNALLDTIVSDINAGKTSSNPNLAEINKLITRNPEEYTVDSEESSYTTTSVGSLGAMAQYWVKVENYPGDGLEGIPYLYALRTDFLKAPGIKRKKKLAYLMEVLDGDYVEKKLGRFEQFIVTIIVIVIVVVAIKLAGPAGAKITSPLVAAAAVVSTAAFYVSIAAYVLNEIGYYHASIGLQNFLQAAAPLIEIAGYIMVVYGIYRIATYGMQESLKAAGKDAATMSATELAKASMEMAWENIKNPTNLGVSNLMKVSGMIVNAYAYWDSKDLEKKIKREEAKAAEYKELLESSQIDHLAMAMAKYEFDPLKRIYSTYDGLFDRPYEWYATPYHTGNIQRTTVEAFWTKDKKDAIIATI